ncbi:hypothetical protein PG988_006159 [Apiospora saccharicola]
MQHRPVAKYVNKFQTLQPSRNDYINHINHTGTESMLTVTFAMLWGEQQYHNYHHYYFDHHHHIDRAVGRAAPTTTILHRSPYTLIALSGEQHRLLLPLLHRSPSTLIALLGEQQHYYFIDHHQSH